MKRIKLEPTDSGLDVIIGEPPSPALEKLNSLDNVIITLPDMDAGEVESGGLWDTVENRVQALDAQPNSELNLWKVLEDKVNPHLWKPRRLAKVEIVEDHNDPSKEVCYYFKCAEVHAFLKLGEKQLFVWEHMDGDHTVRDIMFAYRNKFGSMPIGAIWKTIGTFRSSKLIDEPMTNVLERANRLGGVKPEFNFFRFMMRSTYNLQNVDPKIEKAYRWGGWLFFKPFVWMPLVAIGVLGLLLAGYISFRGHPLSASFSDSGSPLLLIVAYLSFLPMLFLHEMSHALAVKHFKREVLGGGFMLIKTLPAVYVDTTDMWMDRNKWHRVAVSLIGPATNLVLGGSLILIALGTPDRILAAFFYAIALNNFFQTIFNLCPFIEFDGYYALMDALGETALRGKSFRFIRTELPKRWTKFYRFSRREWLYTIFGLCAGLYTLGIISMGCYMIANFLLSSTIGIISALFLVAFIGIPTIWGWSSRMLYERKHGKGRGQAARQPTATGGFQTKSALAATAKPGDLEKDAQKV